MYTTMFDFRERFIESEEIIFKKNITFIAFSNEEYHRILKFSCRIVIDLAAIEIIFRKIVISDIVKYRFPSILAAAPSVSLSDVNVFGDDLGFSRFLYGI